MPLLSVGHASEKKKKKKKIYGELQWSSCAKRILERLIFLLLLKITTYRLVLKKIVISTFTLVHHSFLIKCWGLEIDRNRMHSFAGRYFELLKTKVNARHLARFCIATGCKISREREGVILGIFGKVNCYMIISNLLPKILMKMKTPVNPLWICPCPRYQMKTALANRQGV